jgi:hypothetical protein
VALAPPGNETEISIHRRFLAHVLVVGIRVEAMAMPAAIVIVGMIRLVLFQADPAGQKSKDRVAVSIGPEWRRAWSLQYAWPHWVERVGLPRILTSISARTNSRRKVDLRDRSEP